MTEPSASAQNGEAFEAIVDLIGEVVDPGALLPEWPFRTRKGFVQACEYKRSIGGSFAQVIGLLAQAFGDQKVSMAVLDPPSSFYSLYSFFPAFRVNKEQLPLAYWEAVNFEPDGDVTGAIVHSANKFALVGDSGKWAVWGQRDWEIALLLTAHWGGPWLELDIPFEEPRSALQHFRGPDGWTMPLSEQEIGLFLKNMDRYGSGG